MNRKLTNERIAMGHEWCIAGGWAACPGLASDQDVWVFIPVNDSGDFPVRVKRLVIARGQMLRTFPEIKAESTKVPQTPEELMAAYGDLGMFVQKVGKLGDRHIMVCDAPDVKTLLNTFDISTHQCAITSDNRFVKGDDWTPITEPLVIHRLTDTTPARIDKIRARYRL